MKRLIALLVLASTVLFAFNEFIPVSYDFVFLSRNNAKYYDQIKKYPCSTHSSTVLGLKPWFKVSWPVNL